MSGAPGKPSGGADRPDAPSEGWESLAEENEGSLSMNPELEAALREAADAIPDGTPTPPPKAEEEVLLGEPLEPISADDEQLRLQEQVTASNDRLIRLQADFANFRKRALKERTDALRYGSQNLVKDLLSVVDNLERAIDHARKSEGGDLQSLLQGVDLVQREFLGVLANHHVEEIQAVGKPFDPALHEAMAQVPAEGVEPNTIVEVLQKGYQLLDRLVRPSRVVVARESAEPGGEGGGETTG